MTNVDDIILNIVDDQIVEEGLGQMVQLGILASVLGCSGMVDAQELKDNIVQVGRQNGRGQSRKMTLTKSMLGDAIDKSRSTDSKKRIGKWTKEQIINIVARTLWMEARGEGDESLKMVLTVIQNRAGGLPEFLADKCLERKQFSCWNGLENRTPETYSINFPRSALSSERECSLWNKCQRLATMAVEGEFVSVNDDWNSYYNPKVCNPSWGRQLSDATVVGHHRVGSLPEWRTKANRLVKSELDRPESNTYVVKKNDNLWRIAKDNGTTVDELKRLNNLSSNTLNIGQRLRIS